MKRIIILCLLLCAYTTHANEVEYVSLEIFPHNVGVFYSSKTQQFKAYGITAEGRKVDVTTQVDWSLESRPISSEQILRPGQMATINSTGLLTLREGVTWGRCGVVATYPKRTGINPVVLQLLLFKNNVD